jgi:hypothetical protein
MDLREWGGIDWINLAEGKDQWRTVVITVMNLRVPGNVSQEGLSSMKLLSLFCYIPGPHIGADVGCSVVILCFLQSRLRDASHQAT